jgi:hypothetical protein
MKQARRHPDAAGGEAAIEIGTYMACWMALSPAERLRRSWRLRRRIKDLGAVHDAKTVPEL